MVCDGYLALKQIALHRNAWCEQFQSVIKLLAAQAQYFCRRDRLSACYLVFFWENRLASLSTAQLRVQALPRADSTYKKLLFGLFAAALRIALLLLYTPPYPEVICNVLHLGFRCPTSIPIITSRTRL